MICVCGKIQMIHECYGKYKIDFNDDFFFHPTYHGTLDPQKNLPGYQGGRLFSTSVSPINRQIPVYTVAEVVFL